MKDLAIRLLHALQNEQKTSVRQLLCKAIDLTTTGNEEKAEAILTKVSAHQGRVNGRLA
jgi:hypothetical protein